MADNEKKDDKKDQGDNKNDSSTEEEGYTCGKCCSGYGFCIVAMCKVNF